MRQGREREAYGEPAASGEDSMKVKGRWLTNRDTPAKSQRDLSTSGAIMTMSEVAAWLRIHPRQVGRLGIPCLDFGRKTKRYLVKDVEAWLDSKRRGRR